jgi:hypothetical protein
LADERLADMRADEAAGAGDQNALIVQQRLAPMLGFIRIGDRSYQSHARGSRK